VGTRGAVPKRSDQRRRRNVGDEPDVVEISGAAVLVPPLRDDIHPLAASWYAALAESGQSRFYEPSDWMMAQIVAEAIEVYATSRKSTTLTGILAGSSLLLATEGDRRRMRLELTRATTESASDDNVIDWRARATSGT
jgi:hypothetical protein